MDGADRRDAVAARVYALKSAPAERIEDNLRYEVRQSMRRRSPAEIGEAVATWLALLNALASKAPWGTAEQLYASAKTRRWFDDSLIPSCLKLPLRGAIA